MVTFFLAWHMTSPSTDAAGVLFRPILNPVGHHSTKDTLLFCFNHCTVALDSFDL